MKHPVTYRIYHSFIGRNATPVTREKIAETEFRRVEGIDVGMAHGIEVGIMHGTRIAATKTARRLEVVDTYQLANVINVRV